MCVFSIKWENRIEPLIWRNLCRWEKFSPLYTELTSTTSVTSHFRSAPLCTGSWWAQVAQDSCYGKCYLNKPRIRIPVAANIALLQERFPEISGAHLRNVISIIRALTGDPRGADRAGKMGNSFFYQSAAWISLKMQEWTWTERWWRRRCWWVLYTERVPRKNAKRNFWARKIVCWSELNIHWLLGFIEPTIAWKHMLSVEYSNIYFFLITIKYF